MAAGAIDPEKVLYLRREVARLVGVFPRWQREAGEIPALFVRHGRRTGRKKLRHDGQVVVLEIFCPPEWRRFVSKANLRKVKERAVGGDVQTRDARWGYAGGISGQVERNEGYPQKGMEKQCRTAAELTKEAAS